MLRLQNHSTASVILRWGFTTLIMENLKKQLIWANLPEILLKPLNMLSTSSIQTTTRGSGTERL